MKLLLIALAVSAVSASQLLPSCDRPVYCDSKLLHHVQMARIFPDSKTFVDLHMKNDEKTILDAFNVLLQRTHEQPSKEQLKQFVNEHFDSIEELEKWTPEDYNKEPEFLLKIKDIELRQFAKNIHNIWPILGRKVSPQVLAKPDSFSMLPVNNGFIIPGLRLNEMYYWDTYWIIEGLLVSGMKGTVRGILSNLMDLQRTFGHIPNGNRWYFEQRSQPPLLSAMVMKYLEATHDVEFLKSNIDALESELQYWINEQSVIFKKDGKEHTLLRYFTPSAGPRPEWYNEDYSQAEKFLSEDLKQQFYNNIKSAAESGWDFSSRWFINENGTNIGDISTTRASDIVPVDLNAIFTSSMQNMAYFYSLMHNSRKGAHWAHIAKQWRNSIKEVMWNDEDGIWYDWDLLNEQQRKYFYPSNIAPLWMDVVDEEFKKEHAQAILEYLKKTHSLEFPGGVPTSFSRTGQKWDYPYAWAPLVSMVVKSLEALKTEESGKLAYEVAKNWIRSNLLGYNTYKQLFDKYDVETPGKLCSEDIYTLHAGFGWTIGATLQMLTRYGRTLKAQDSYYNFNTYKPNPVFWHIPTSAYLPAYYKSVKTAPVFTGDKASNIPTVKPEEPVIIIQIDPTRPSYEIEKEIILSTTFEPEVSTSWQLEQELTTAEPALEEKNLLEAHKEHHLYEENSRGSVVSSIPVSIKPQVIPTVPVKPEIVPSIPVRPQIIPVVPVKPEVLPSTIKPQIIHAVPLKAELVPVNPVRPQFVPSLPLKPEQIKPVPVEPSLPLRPEIVEPVRPELVSSLPLKPEQIKPVPVKPSLPLRPEIVEPVRPELVSSLPLKLEQIKPVPVKPSLPLRPEIVEPVRPELVSSLPLKPEQIKPVPVKPSLPLRPEIVEPVKPELVSSSPLKPELVKPVLVNPSLSLRPEIVEPVKPVLVPSLPLNPEIIKPVPVKPYLNLRPEIVEPAKPELVPSLPLKPELVKPVPVKPESVSSAQLKPEIIPSQPLKPDVVVVTNKPQVIPAVHQESLYPAQISSSYGSNLHISEVARDVVIPSVPVSHVKPQVIPSVQPELIPSASIKPIEYKGEITYNKPVSVVEQPLIKPIEHKEEISYNKPIRVEEAPLVVVEYKEDNSYNKPIRVEESPLIQSIEHKEDISYIKPVRVEEVPLIKPIEHKEELSYNKPLFVEQPLILSGSSQAQISSTGSAILHAEKPKVEVVPPTVQSGYVAQSGYHGFSLF